jgi:hypothetical protein
MGLSFRERYLNAPALLRGHLMIRDEVQRMVEQLFPNVFGDAEGTEGANRTQVLKALNDGGSLSLLGERLGFGANDLLSLKKIQAAQRIGTLRLRWNE